MTTAQDAIITALKGDGVGVLPSDTIYGLSCLALNQEAVERIYQLKGRDYHKPLIILLANIEQAGQLGIEPNVLEPVRKLWPAPLTVIVSTGQMTPEFLHRGMHALAVRIPNNAELRELISEIGPIVSTSANVQGQKPANSVAKAREYFGDRLDFYIDAGVLNNMPSTLVRLKNDKLRIIRQGAYKVPDDKIY